MTQPTEAKASPVSPRANPQSPQPSSTWTPTKLPGNHLTRPDEGFLILSPSSNLFIAYWPSVIPPSPLVRFLFHPLLRPPPRRPLPRLRARRVVAWPPSPTEPRRAASRAEERGARRRAAAAQRAASSVLPVWLEPLDWQLDQAQRPTRSPRNAAITRPAALRRR